MDAMAEKTVTLPLFLLSMGRDFGLTGSWSHAPWMNWLFLVLATPVQFYTGWDYYVGGFKSLRNKSANMDVLVALGSSVAYVYSLSILLFSASGGHVYFETSAVIITLIKLGKLLEARTKGKTVMAAVREERFMGLLAVADQIKEDSPGAVSALHKLGLKVIMLTGDNLRTARSIAAQAGIDEAVADVRPEDKAAKVREVQETGRIVGMVGDGINDAPALARADVGLAIGTGTDVAIETADVILSSGSLKGIPRAIAVSRATLRTVRQNLFLAFVYNTLLIPVVAGVLAPIESLPMVLRQLHPILAALAMSSISVVSNSLRLYKANIR